MTPPAGAPHRTFCAASTLTGTPSSECPAARSRGLRPIRARARRARASLRWSGPYRETDSGAVSAGSNPAGTLLRGIDSNTLTISQRKPAGAVTCGNS